MRRSALVSVFVLFLLVFSVSPNFSSLENIVEVNEGKQNLSTLDSMEFGTKPLMEQTSTMEQTAERSDPEYRTRTAKELYLDQVESEEIATQYDSIFELLKNTPKENYWIEEANIIVTFESKDNFIQPYFDDYDNLIVPKYFKEPLRASGPEKNF